ncbi:polyphosphate kinase 2 family protein [Microbacterium sp. LRZ72]|uniref:PPK2 family polyphosphate kinase n=1 Tax=Microbacterium sp. LRZ72 TaxID=2942481 RepID=UPI0029B69302|nr:PPK2 family polyphosphate kinase [Microbacterium sp. LRZ72]MDX2377321.1 polyphosphate kinase 2 family protein [Microbacterium sp. LRZ72]
MSASSRYSWTAEARDVLRVRDGFVITGTDPSSTPAYDGEKDEGRADLAAGLDELGQYQERLFAARQTGDADDAVLLVLQGMDTAGKGGIVRHVVGGVDPQGVELASFKKPTPEELEQDFLWRIARRAPEPGMIGVFDRSHYEDVLVGRVRGLADPAEIERRYDAINEFEAGLVERGIRVVKVMLHISYEEQRERLAERLERPDKHWKYNPGDVDERLLWPHYMSAYQRVFDRTSTEHAPWFVVPADRKWYARVAVQTLLLETFEQIDPAWPGIDYDIEAEKARLAAT